uniref:phenylalanine--tRNA ligase subunit alpha n=1 Tax=Buchnera aphidicola TaxID=9 RepID=UPI003F5CC337
MDINVINDHKELENLRIKYLGKKGLIAHQINLLKHLPLVERKRFGKIINNVKHYIYTKINNKKIFLDDLLINKNISLNNLDLSLPGRRSNIGSMHPITSTIYYIERFFNSLGFDILSGGFELEDQYHNFDALNIPIYHPARNVQDTFWFDSNFLLRTQTSNMQIHEIKKNKFPIRMIISGKVYRKDSDKTHSPMFHQVEGLVIDKNVNFSNLKWVISNFLNDFFKKNIEIRFRSSYFPFTVLSCEVDIKSSDGSWLEVLGCGIVHPNILKRFNINSKLYSGFAFGIGVERIIMLYYGIKDLRCFFKNDIKFLSQFKKNRYF